MKVINNQNPVVIIDWDDFELLLKKILRKELARIFGEADGDKELVKKWKTYSKQQIIDRIFNNYEEDMRELV